jgi:hypothetical protein
MLAEAIPAQSKLVELSTLLGVNAQWLRYGDEPLGEQKIDLSAREQVLIHNYRGLYPVEQEAIDRLLSAMRLT